jgi:hypothetical protein
VAQALRYTSFTMPNNKLKRTYANLDEVEEQFRPLYEVKDGKAVLAVEVEGLVPASKVEDFRQTNIRERAEHEAAMAKYKDVDVDKYHDLLGKEKDLEDSKLVKRGELDNVRRQAIEEAVQPWKQKEQEWSRREQKLHDRLERAIIESRAVEAAVQIGLKKGASKDLIARAREIFKVNDDGELQAYEEDGKTPRYHLGDPYTIEQFVKDLSNNDDGKHLFEENVGVSGEAIRNRGGGPRDFLGEVNPWNPKSINRSLQGEIITKDRSKAIRMAKQFGVIIPEQPYANAAR